MAISWKDWKLRQESIHKLWGCWRSGSYEVGDVKHSSAMIRSSSWPQTEWGYFKPLCTQLATTWVLSKAKIVLRPLASGLLSPPVRWWERWVFRDISWRYLKNHGKMKFEKNVSLVWNVEVHKHLWKTCIAKKMRTQMSIVLHQKQSLSAPFFFYELSNQPNKFRYLFDPKSLLSPIIAVF